MLKDYLSGLNFNIMESSQHPHKAPVKLSHSIEGTFLWAVSLFGTVENGAVFLTVICSRKFKKPLHLLIGSLAMTDLFVSLIFIPSYMYYLLEHHRMIRSQDDADAGAGHLGGEESLNFCQLSRSIFIKIASVSLTLKTLIALYLYISVSSQEWAAKVFSLRNTLTYVSAAWAINCAMLFIPKVLGYPGVDFYPNSFVCSVDPNIRHTSLSQGMLSTVYTFTMLIMHITELAVICVCFVKVHLAIMHGKVYSERHRSSDKQAKINYMRALKITYLVFVSFCICWMPIYIVNILDPMHKVLPVAVHHLVMDLLLLKSSINPAIYIYGIRSLRYEIKVLCLCRCRKGNNSVPFTPPRATNTSSAEDGPSSNYSTI